MLSVREPIGNWQVGAERGVQPPDGNLLFAQVRALVARHERMKLQPQAESPVDRRRMQDATRMSVARFLGPVLTDDRATVRQTEDVNARRPKLRLLSARR